MKKSERADDRVFYRILKMSNRSMLEHIMLVGTEKREYKEYIEQWIHEFKTPLAALKLICENHKTDLNKLIIPEIEKINYYAEQVLFYARSEQVEKDYFV